MMVHASVETWNPERIGAVAIYCSDGRWGEAFDEFCHKRLLIPRYDRLAVPGGPAWLVARAASHNLYQPAREQLDFLVRIHELQRIVLITHFGCAFYHELVQQPPEDCLAAQMEDLVHSFTRRCGVVSGASGGRLLGHAERQVPLVSPGELLTPPPSPTRKQGMPAPIL